MAGYPSELWDEIRASYATGMFSFRELEAVFREKYGQRSAPSASAIRKRQVAEAWPKDLTKQVRDSARGELLRQTGGHNVSEAQAVKEAAAAMVEVIRSHRTRLGRLGAVVDKLLEELEALVDGRCTGTIIEVFRKGEKVGENLSAHFMGQNESLSDVLTKLMRCADSLHKQERTAFDIDAVQGEDSAADHESALEAME